MYVADNFIFVCVLYAYLYDYKSRSSRRIVYFIVTRYYFVVYEAFKFYRNKTLLLLLKKRIRNVTIYQLIISIRVYTGH